MKIKQIPEDFVVIERIELKYEEGPYFYFKLKKREWNTLDAAKKISERLNIELKKIGYAGNKDKNAVTEQAISIMNTSKEKVENLKIKDIELIFLGTGKERINLGDLYGNDFVITVRDFDEEINIKKTKIKNYFDDQRFGADNKNHMIGKAIVQKKLEEACELLDLNVNGKEYVNALSKIGKKMLRFYIHSYQSYLFNKALEKIDRENLPVPGFLTKFEDKEVEKIYSEILNEEGIKLKDFIIPSMKEISSEGSTRSSYLHLSNLKIEWMQDELNKGKKKAVLNFSLSKGEYATTAIKSLFSKSI